MRRLLFFIIMTVISLSAIGCSAGGGSNNPGQPETTVYGTAAAGAPIIGAVYVKDSQGKVKSTYVNEDGTFSIDVADMTKPFIIYAHGFSGYETVDLYSVSLEGGRTNVTSATTLVVALALQNDPSTEWPLATITDETTVLDAPSSDEIETAKDDVAQVIGVSSSFDLITGSFNADRTGFDLIMEKLDMEVIPGATLDIAVTDKITGEEYTAVNTFQESSTNDFTLINAITDKVFQYLMERIIKADLSAVCAGDIMESGVSGAGAVDAIVVFERKPDNTMTWGVNKTVIETVEAVTLADLGFGAALNIGGTDYTVDTTTAINDPGTGRQAVCCLEQFWVKLKSGGDEVGAQDYVFYYINDGSGWKYWGNRALVETQVYADVNNWGTAQNKVHIELKKLDTSTDPDFIVVTGDGIPAGGLIYKKSSSDWQYTQVSGGEINAKNVRNLVYHFTALKIDGSTLVPVASWAYVCDGYPSSKDVTTSDFADISTWPGSLANGNALVLNWTIPAGYRPEVKICVNDDYRWSVNGTSLTIPYADMNIEDTAASIDVEIRVYDINGIKYSSGKTINITGK